MRTQDAPLINTVANHPAVRPHIGLGGAGYLDFAEVVSNPAFYALKVDHGVMLFAPKEPGVYELHTLIMPEGRGAGVLPSARQAFAFMFSHGAETLTTFAPASNRPASLMARRAGFVPVSVDPKAWEDGSDITHFRLTRADWLSRNPEAT